MLCPYCGGEMQKGYIQSRDNVYWSMKKRPIAALTFFAGEIVTLNNDPDSNYSGKVSVAHCCKACQKIVIDFDFRK